VDLENFGADRVRQRSLSILDSTFQNEEAPGLVEDMDAGKVDAWLVHLAEGTGGDALLEFDVLKDVCLLRSETVIIHGTALTPSDLDEVAEAKTKLIISPTSNYLYYGDTTDVLGAVDRGITVALSTDWSPAGDKNLLAALKSLDLINETVWFSTLTEFEMVEMVTTAPARILNWCELVGSLRAGLFADLTVVLGEPSMPYRSLIEATEEDVLLTVVDGEPLHGRPSFLETFKADDRESVLGGCGFGAALDITDPDVMRGEEFFSETSDLLRDASAFDFHHMKENFKDPAVAGMTDEEFQAYLDERFPLDILPGSLDPHWVVDDGDYFENLRSEENVNALDPAATLDIEPYWDVDADGILNPCEPALRRSLEPLDMSLHIDNLQPPYVDDYPGTLSDGIDYFYRIDPRGSPDVTIILEKRHGDDTVRIHF
jgi:hypothetical protein